ncbi:MAG: AsnC family protein [Acidimicrobiia bacterium]
MDLDDANAALATASDDDLLTGPYGGPSETDRATAPRRRFDDPPSAATSLSLTSRKALAAELLERQPDLSDRAVGRQCGLSPATVASLRARAQMASADHTPMRLGRDGRSRPVDGGALRQRIAAAIQEDPDASLRTIARRVGASPETVRSVRLQLSQAEPDAAPRPLSRTAPPAEVDLLLAMPPVPTPARSWQEDTACQSTSDGAAFASWFEESGLDDQGWREFVHSVPLSRVYEIIDEARRRSSVWTGFAQALEERVDRTTRMQRAI